MVTGQSIGLTGFERQCAQMGSAAPDRFRPVDLDLSFLLTIDSVIKFVAERVLK